MIGLKFRGIFALACLILLIAGYFAGYVWKENKYVVLAKKKSILQTEIKRLESEIVKIQLDNKQLKDYKRLENLGREQFGLIFGGVPKFINPEGPLGETLARLD